MTTPAHPLWRTTPPALFPPIFGLFGLSLAWRRGAELWDFGAGLVATFFWIALALYLLCIAAYIAKLMSRPAAIREDLATLPGRGGVPVMSMCLLILAAALVPLSTGVAAAVLALGVAAHMLAAGLVITALRRAEAAPVTPAWHLSFVGFIVIGLTAAPLGLRGLAMAVLAITLPIALGICGISLNQVRRAPPPPPVRPMLAIHIAPFALFGTVAFLLGSVGVAMVFAAIATVILAALLIRWRWVLAAGVTPAWGALTFPVAAYAGLCLALGGDSGLFLALGAAALALCTLLIPFVAVWMLRGWIDGSLAQKTGAAVA